MVRNKENKANIRIIANNLVKNNRMIQKYNRLDAQLSDMTFKYFNFLFHIFLFSLL
jgi:hypothetical protein